LIVELSFIPAPSFADQAAPETPTCLNQFRQAIGFGSPITPSKAPGQLLAITGDLLSLVHVDSLSSAIFTKVSSIPTCHNCIISSITSL
jgi:hypothetical protein